MGIVEQKLQNDALTEFENRLLAIDALDKKITEEIEEVEEASSIIHHKRIFFSSREIDLSKVNKSKLEQIKDELQQLLRSQRKVLTNLSRAISLFKPLDRYEEKLAAFLKREIRDLFTTIQLSLAKVREILEFLDADFSKNDLEDDFEDLDRLAEDIRKFIRQLVYYTEFWKERSTHKPYLNVRIVRKTRQYNADVEKYSDFKKRIIYIENRIETAPKYEKKLHEKIKKGPLAGLLHARVNTRLRAFYSWDPSTGTLTYKHIMTKSDFRSKYQP